MIEGWGKFVDPAFDSKVELDKDVLVMTAPDAYVDNFHKTTAPRVMQDVSSDFAAEVTVLHVDPSKPNTVLKSLGDFPTACHSGTLLIRQDDRNFVRLRRNVEVGVSITSNTETGCTVKFRDFKITTAK